jgi:hypothetical protein
MVFGMILFVILSGERTAPAGAGWKSAERWSVGVRKSSLNDRWQLGEGLGPLLVLPLLTSAGAILEVQLIEHMLHRRQDRPA